MCLAKAVRENVQRMQCRWITALNLCSCERMISHSHEMQVMQRSMSRRQPRTWRHNCNGQRRLAWRPALDLHPAPGVAPENDFGDRRSSRQCRAAQPTTQDGTEDSLPVSARLIGHGGLQLWLMRVLLALLAAAADASGGSAPSSPCGTVAECTAKSLWHIPVNPILSPRPAKIPK